MENEPKKSKDNKKLADDLRKEGFYAVEMYHPDPERNDEVIAVLVSATAPDKKWLKWLAERLLEGI